MSIKFVGNKSINKLISLIKNYIDESVKPLKGKNGQLIGFDENGDQIPVEIKIPSVSVTPTASSGTKVGTITIDGKSYDLYAPSVTTDSIGAANKSHNHNDIYYTESEIDNKLANKSNNGHTHNYAATNHSHSGYVQTSKITQSSSVTATGQYVLDAIEKNASIEGTLAHQIAQANSNLTQNTDGKFELPNGLKICWGSCTGGTITFPFTFTARPTIVATFVNNNTEIRMMVHFTTISTTAAKYVGGYKQADDWSGNYTSGVNWIAIGY